MLATKKKWARISVAWHYRIFFVSHESIESVTACWWSPKNSSRDWGFFYLVTPPPPKVQQAEGDRAKKAPLPLEKSKLRSNTHHSAHSLLVWASHMTMPLCKCVLGNVLTDWEDASEQKLPYCRRRSIHFFVWPANTFVTLNECQLLVSCLTTLQSLNSILL